MVRSHVYVAVVAAASAGGLLAGEAAAVTPEAVVPAIVAPAPGAPVTGICAPLFVAAGIGSTGGLPYEMNGAAVSADPRTVATQIECKFYDTDTATDALVAYSGYKAGPIAVLQGQVVLHTLDNVVACAKVDTVNSDGSTTASPWVRANGAPCS